MSYSFIRSFLFFFFFFPLTPPPPPLHLSDTYEPIFFHFFDFSSVFLFFYFSCYSFHLFKNLFFSYYFSSISSFFFFFFPIFQSRDEFIFKKKQITKPAVGWNEKKSKENWSRLLECDHQFQRDFPENPTKPRPGEQLSFILFYFSFPRWPKPILNEWISFANFEFVTVLRWSVL